MLENKCYAAEALAFYQWPGSYDYLISCIEKGASIHRTIFAILGDKRAIPLIIKEYRKIDKKYQKQPEHSYALKMPLLNVLYHLASPETLPFIEEVINNPRPEKIKSRALKVKERIISLSKKK